MSENIDKRANKTSINWYPGHMAKTMKQIEQDLKLIDIVIEIVDARIPFSSQNPQVHKIIKDKKKIIILNKADLADEKETKNWIRKFESQGIPAVECNSNNGDGINRIISQINNNMQEEKEKALSKGRTGKIIRAMIIGVPNVGKSSFINRISKKTTMQVGNKPGVTKQKQWIRLSNNIELLDTPGILWPRMESNKVSLNLAYTGTIKSSVLDEIDIAYNFLKYMMEEYKENIITRYLLNPEIVNKILENTDIEENEKIVEVMNYIGEKRGAILKGNNIDLGKVSRIVLEDFKNGNLGKITLEKVKIED